MSKQIHLRSHFVIWGALAAGAILFVACATKVIVLTPDQQITSTPLPVITTALVEIEAAPTKVESASPSPTSAETAIPLNTLAPSPTTIPSLTPIIYSNAVFTTSQVITGTTMGTWQGLPDALYAFSQEASYFVWTPEKDQSSLGRYIQGGPEAALSLAFSHFSEQVAYWKASWAGELWLAGLTLSAPRLLFSDQQDNYPRTTSPVLNIILTWTPDDQHLIVEVPQAAELNQIHHITAGGYERWLYACDRVALSPSTRKLATWCPSLEIEGTFAVIEWGGQIWYSESPSIEEFLQQRSDGISTWAWSADGEKIAYFDPADPEGHLFIADRRGELKLKTLPRGAYWLWRGRPPSPPLQWSRDGSRLLVFARGSSANPCPGSPVGGIQVSFGPPCWQVIEADSGEVVWTIAEILDEFLSVSQQAALLGHEFSNPALSPDGRFLAIDLRFPGVRGVYLIDLDAGQVERILNFNVQAMRWGLAP